MRADENAAFFPEFLKKNGCDRSHARQKAETAVPDREQMDDEVEQKRGKTERWYAFKTP